MTPWVFVPDSNRVPDFVLDAAVPAAWLLYNSSTKYTRDVLSRLIRSVAVVPESWFVDLAHCLRLAEDTGETTAPQVDRFLAGLPSFSILIDDETTYRAWGDTLTLARAHQVAAADAAYLELARRLSLPLATINPTLTRAAASANVPLYTP